jgi:hypothetical protein
MPNSKRKQAQPSTKKPKQQKPSKHPMEKTSKTRQRSSQQAPKRREGPGDPGQPIEQPMAQPLDQPIEQMEAGNRRRPGEGLDKSDEGVVAGGRLAGRRFTG